MLKKSWIRFVLLLFAEMIILIFNIILTAAVAGTVVVLILNGFPFLKTVADATIGAAAGLSQFDVYGNDANILFLTYHAIAAAFPFIRAKIRLKTLRCFFKAADRKPPVGRIYARFGDAISRLLAGIRKDKKTS